MFRFYFLCKNTVCRARLLYVLSLHSLLRLRESLWKKQTFSRRHATCVSIRRMSQIRRLYPVWHCLQQCWGCGWHPERVRLEKAHVPLKEINMSWTTVTMIVCSNLSQILDLITFRHVFSDHCRLKICTQQKGYHFPRKLCWAGCYWQMFWYAAFTVVPQRKVSYIGLS